jgi:hypothetical protein
VQQVACTGWIACQHNLSPDELAYAACLSDKELGWLVMVQDGCWSADAAAMLPTHPSSDVSGRAVKPKGLSFLQFLRSCASRALAVPLQQRRHQTLLTCS